MPDLAAKRHALNLPAGSVRAAHVLSIIGLFCAILLVPPKNPEIPVAIPPYLLYLVFLAVGHYFAAHGVTIATRAEPAPSPLYLPGGVVRVLIVVALAGAIGWKIYSDRSGLLLQFESSLDALKAQPYLPLVILGGFLVGVIIRSLVGRENPPVVWQDLEAWVSVLALAGLGTAAVIHMVQGTLLVPFGLPLWESILGGLLAFYFGARS